MQIKSFKKTMLCATAAVIFISSTAFAQNVQKDESQSMTMESPIDIMPAKNTKTDTHAYSDAFDTHPPLKISPDKSELVRLEKDAGSIIVGSPSHLSVLADSARTLVLVPQIPGATYVTILDKQGNVLMQRHVIIGSPKKKYVRIRKSCNGDTEGCEPTQVYYCPDTCHKVNVAQEPSETETSGFADENANNAPENVPEAPAQ